MADQVQDNDLFTNAGLIDPQGKQLGSQLQMNEGQADGQQAVQLWTAVHKQHTLNSDGSLTGFVYSIGPNDMAVQIIRKYGKFAVHIGCFKCSINGGPPVGYNSESYLAKK